MMKTDYGNVVVFVHDMIFATSTNQDTGEVAMSIQLNSKPLEILFSKEQIEIMLREFNKLLPEITYSTPIAIDEVMDRGTVQ